ncbi:MAG: hypothetical protein EXR27_22135 [Betaproteobacteria bacterium]|nr:hypothetical protein [Betaproteobacteria bacterium]
MHGWRARIGLIIADSNTTIEPEFNRLAPEGVSMHVSRVPIAGISAEGLSTSDGDMATATRLLCNINARALAYACNGANVVLGADGEQAQARQLSAMTGVPTIMASAAVYEALTALGARRVAFATPYPADLNAHNDAYWKAAGFEVVRSGGVNLGGGREPCEPFSSAPISRVGLQTPEMAYNLARSVCDDSLDAVVVLGCNLRSIEAAARFEADFGVTFLSSNLALLWASLQAAGIREPITGYGRLLQQQPRLTWQRIQQRW